jgi:hypothetical protein
MAAETWLTYNGITLRNVLTRRFEQTPVYDRSDTDLVYHKVTIAVTGYMHGQSGTGPLVETHPTNDGGGNPWASGADQYAGVRARLLSPRGHLEMDIGANTLGNAGVVFLEVGPHSPGVTPKDPTRIDVRNGPKPRKATISQFIGSSVLKVDFEIEVCIVECNEAGEVPNNHTGVLSNRWSLVDSIDRNRHTTRTVTGILKTHNGLVNPNTFRRFVVPSLQEGFTRESVTYRVTEDSLDLEYTIVDKEISYSAPPPATSWSYRVSEEAADGKTAFSSIDLQLNGDRDVDKTELIRVGIAIIQARLYGGTLTSKNAIAEAFQIIDEYGDGVNRVTLHAKVRRVLGKTTNMILGAMVDNSGQPITQADISASIPLYAYNRNTSRSGNPGDDVELSGPIPLTTAWHAYLQSPCNATHKIADASLGIDSGNRDSTNTRYTLNATVVSALGAPAAYTSSEHEQAAYTHYQVESKYQSSQQRVALPVAGLWSSLTTSTKTLVPITLALGGTHRVIRITAQRIGDSPILPAPADSYTVGLGTAVLMKNAVTVDTPTRTADGKQLHTARAEYVYALTVPPQSTDSLPIGFNPWEDAAFATHTTDAGMLGGPNP